MVLTSVVVISLRNVSYLQYQLFAFKALKDKLLSKTTIFQKEKLGKRK